jgi:hypothetical protein
MQPAGVRPVPVVKLNSRRDCSPERAQPNVVNDRPDINGSLPPPNLRPLAFNLLTSWPGSSSDSIPAAMASVGRWMVCCAGEWHPLPPPTCLRRQEQR